MGALLAPEVHLSDFQIFNDLDKGYFTVYYRGKCLLSSLDTGNCFGFINTVMQYPTEAAFSQEIEEFLAAHE